MAGGAALSAGRAGPVVAGRGGLSRLRERRDPAVAALVLLALAAGAGLAIARGDLLSLLLVGGLAATALAVILREHGETALLIWVIGGAVAFPLARVPRDEPLITFDRIWIGSMILVVLLGASGRADAAPAWAGGPPAQAGEPGSRPSGPTRLLWWSLAWFAVAFGARTVSATRSGRTVAWGRTSSR